MHLKKKDVLKRTKNSGFFKFKFFYKHVKNYILKEIILYLFIITYICIKNVKNVT